jgi:hypothetical protein
MGQLVGGMLWLSCGDTVAQLVGEWGDAMAHLVGDVVDQLVGMRWLSWLRM